MKKLDKLYIKFVNSAFWFHIYYKHSKEHKKDLADIKASVIARTKRILGK